MSFTERLVLWFHVAFVIFTIGPVTIATMSSPRAIRNRNAALLRHHLRMTRIFTAAALGVLIFGIVAAQQLNDMGKAWLSVSMTLFVVALVLLVLIMRDQRRAAAALEAAATEETAAPPAATAGQAAGDQDLSDPGGAASGTEGTVETEGGAGPGRPGTAGAATQVHVANVERGRIASMAGVVSLIWVAILVLMVWNS
jgi:hypothetical protein